MGLSQLNFEDKDKVQVAIVFLKEYEPPEGYYGAFSGGKDSVVIKHLAKQAGVKVDWHYCVSPIDSPEIYKFIRQYHPDVQWDYYAKGFWKKVLSKGLPMRPPVGHRWCCKLIKEAGGRGRIKILGMRSEESNTRHIYTEFSEFKYENKTEHTYWLLPILSWDEAEVWEYIELNKLPYCSLYDEGFARIGCVLCPYLSAKQTQKQIERFPKLARLWRLYSDKYFDIRIQRETPLPYATKDELWNWWISRK